MNRLVKTLLWLACGGLLWPAWLIGQESPTPDRIAASNVVVLRERVGQRVVVYGRVESTGKSSGGHQFLNFSGRQLSAFCPPEAAAKFTSGGPAELYRNKDVEVTGELSLYNGKLQIKLQEPGDIKEVRPSAQSTPARSVELKEIAPEVWRSPAGLRYQGRDPEGLNRVEHILRHIRDIPDRDGSHGVFDGGSGVAFAVIDEAWQLAQKKKLRPQVEGDRSSYLVHLNRRVGYLGGRTGQERGHPPLTRIFIVFETGTTNIVTAFPR